MAYAFSRLVARSQLWLLGPPLEEKLDRLLERKEKKGALGGQNQARDWATSMRNGLTNSVRPGIMMVSVLIRRPGHEPPRH